MEGSTSSDKGRDDPYYGIFCFCGEIAPLRTSTTRKNPGRKFFGCTNYKLKENCGFFCWYDQCESSLQNKRRKTLVVSDSRPIMDPSVWKNLAPEIIDHVLSLLPVKCVCQFKCVSPSWNSLISSPDFAKTHLHVTNNTPNKPQKTLLISGSHALYSIDFAAANPTAEKLDFMLPVRNPTNRVRGWGSCNGLVLVSDDGLAQVYDEGSTILVPSGGINYILFLFNPFTRECKELPDARVVDLRYVGGNHFVVNGVGYDSSTDDYKVVMLHCREIFDYNKKSHLISGLSNVTNVAVYSLKTDAWRRIQDLRYHPIDHLHGVCFNECLHWLCWRTNGSIVVVSFDLCDEIFREVHLPTSLTSSNNNRLGGHDFRIVPGSSLCLVVPSYEGGGVDVWMMMKYGIRESWTKFTIAHGMSLELVLYLAAEEEFVLRIIQEVSGVMNQPGREKLVVYNSKNKTVRDKVVCGIPSKYMEGGNYIQTLVSPNHGGQVRRHYEASLGESSKSYQLIEKEHPSSSPAN